MFYVSAHIFLSKTLCNRKNVITHLCDFFHIFIFFHEYEIPVRKKTVFRFQIFVDLPSGHRTLEQRRNVDEIRSFRCSKLNFDVIPTSRARQVVTADGDQGPVS